MSRLPHRTFGEGQKASLLKLGVSLVFKKARLAQCLKQMSSRTADFRASQGAGKLRLQVQVVRVPSNNRRPGIKSGGMISVASEYRKRSRINSPGRSVTGESMISRSVRSFGRIILENQHHRITADLNRVRGLSVQRRIG